MALSLTTQRWLIHDEARRLAGYYKQGLGYVPDFILTILSATANPVEEAKYSPDQPRVPAGHPEGGQWTLGPHGEDPSGRVINDPPLEPVYPLESLVLGLSGPGRLALSLRRYLQLGWRSAGWKLGTFKSPQRWANQLKNRNWTADEITYTLKYGKRFPAPNKIHPDHKTIRYQNIETGKFVVRDEVTKEILQISGDNREKEFRPLLPPK